MSLNISKVWVKSGEQDILIPVTDVKEGDQVVVYMGNVIPFDGTVIAGEAMVNQAALTGESEAVRKASLHNITVKGGKFLEAVADADTIVFDKTGTLTKATPTVEEIYSFNGIG